YSITSSASASILSGTVGPSALAVLRLIVRSNLIGCLTEISPDLVPWRILSTSSAPRLNRRQHEMAPLHHAARRRGGGMADRGACGGDGSVRRSLTFSARHVASFSLLAGRRQFLTAAQIAPKTPLAPPSAEAKRQLACKSVELEAEEKSPRAGEKAVRECFRLDA